MVDARQAAAEKLLMDNVEALMEKRASGVFDDEKHPAELSDHTRFADKPPEPEEPPAPPAAPDRPTAGEEETTPRGTWLDRPSVKDQAIKHPTTVRMTHPMSAVLNVSDKADMIEFNRLQAESDDVEAPTLKITECERVFYEGKWSVFVTYRKVEYLKL